MTGDAPPSAAGAPRIWLRVEGLAACAVAVVLFARSGGDWRLFAVLFLAPDLSMLAYLRNPRFGAAGYNLAHTYALPAALSALRLAGVGWALPVALIWAAHIGFDRLLGYGLKYPTGFGFTHLGRIGRDARRAPAVE